jgi:hypothetical protein
MDNINFIFNKLCEEKISIELKDIFKNYKSSDFIKIAYYLVTKRVCIEPKFHRVALRTHVPSYKGAWGFCMVTPRTWCALVQETTMPTNLRYFSKERLIHASTWEDAYPPELRDFWKHSVAEKLAEDTRELERKVFEHNGC